MTLASRAYYNHTGKEPSTSRKRAIDQIFQEMDSRTIGQSFNRLLPSFVVKDQGNSVDIVTLRRNAQAGQISNALRLKDNEDIRDEIKRPGQGGPWWIGHRVFFTMSEALQKHVKNIDDGGHRPNQINWIRSPNNEPWIFLLHLVTCTGITLARQTCHVNLTALVNRA